MSVSQRWNSSFNEKINKVDIASGINRISSVNYKVKISSCQKTKKYHLVKKKKKKKKKRKRKRYQMSHTNQYKWKRVFTFFNHVQLTKFLKWFIHWDIMWEVFFVKKKIISGLMFEWRWMLIYLYINFKTLKVQLSFKIEINLFHLRITISKASLNRTNINILKFIRIKLLPSLICK